MQALLLALLVAPFQASGQASAPPQSLVTVDLVAEDTSLRELVAADFDVTARRKGSYVVELLAGAADLARLDEAGIAYEVVHADLARHYADRARNELGVQGPPSLGAWLTPAFGFGSMGGFYTFAEVESVLDQISAAYPSITTAKFSIGSTLEGREIWAVKVSDNPGVDEGEPEVRFDAMHHAREPEGMQATIWNLLCLLEGYGTDPLATYLVNEREMWFLPCINPDGYVYNQTTDPGGGGLWRKNRRNNGDGSFGIDLNRNYAFEWGFDDLGSSPTTSSNTYRGPSPASEPEVEAMQDFLDDRDFQTALSTHTYSDLWLYPWGYIAQAPADGDDLAEISALATAVNGYFAGPAGFALYVANGVTIDYDYGIHGTFAWTPEIGGDSDGFWPAPSRIVPLAQENELSFQVTALAAGVYLREAGVTLVDQGDGDGFLEPGEAFDVVLDVRNSGRASGSGSVGLASGEALITITGAAAALGSVSSFTTVDNAATPLSFLIDPAAVAGTTFTLETSVSFGGYTQTTEHDFAIGEIRLLVADDAEVDVGWTIGLPGDTASTGRWAYGDPLGTLYNTQQSNPEDDASAGGVNCFTTGNGSTNPAQDDVDDGLTTLVSPPIDLSGAAEARVSYQRWFANLTSPDDSLDVSISDDDGASWESLESIGTTANTWTESSFFVSEHVDLTNQVRLRFVASDTGNASLVEAAVDELAFEVYGSGPIFSMYGTPAIGTPYTLNLIGEPGAAYVIFASPGTASISLPGVVGEILLDPAGLTKIGAGSIPAGGRESQTAPLPNDPGLIGSTFYVQAATIGAQIHMSNRTELTFE